MLKQFIFDHRPDLIVLNSSGGQNSLSTAQMVTGEIVPEVAEMIKNRARWVRKIIAFSFVIFCFLFCTAQIIMCSSLDMIINIALSLTLPQTLSLSEPFCLSNRLSILSLSPSLNLYLFIYLPTYLSISINLFIYLSIYLSFNSFFSPLSSHHNISLFYSI